MTVDAFAPAPLYVIAGTGPYAVPFDYGDAGELRVRVRTDAVTEVQLGLGADFTVSPTGPAVAGTLTLSSARATAHAGQTLLIGRHSDREQGWAGQGGAQETGLETQLDRIVRVLQELTAADLALIADFKRTLRAPELGVEIGPLPVVADRAGRLLTFDVGGSPRAHDDRLIVVSGLGADFATRPAAAAATIAAAVKRVTLAGFADAADGGGADYVRVPAEPIHALKFRSQDRFLPDGSASSGNGGWWEIAAPVLRFEMGGAVQDAPGHTAAIQAVLQATIILGRPATADAGAVYRVESDIVVNGPVIWATPFQVRRGSLSGLYNIDAPPPGLLFYNGSQLRITSELDDNGRRLVRGVRLEGLSLIDAGDTPLPATKRDLNPKPLLETPRTNFCTFEGLWIDGNYRRAVGAWFGRDDGIWNSRIKFSKFTRCGIGMVSGGPLDHTDMEYLNNTFDQCCAAGAAIFNPQAGIIMANSFENNWGIGLYIGGLEIPVRNAVVMGNYCFNNGRPLGGGGGLPPFWGDAHAADGVDTAAIILGGENTPVPYSDFTTEGVNDFAATHPCMTVEVSRNYLVSAHTEYAVISEGGRGCRIAGNTVMSRQGEGFNHIRIVSTGRTTKVEDNWNQNFGTESRALAENGYRIPLWRDPGNGDDVPPQDVNLLGSGIIAAGGVINGDLVLFGAQTFGSSAAGYTHRTRYELLAFGPSAPGDAELPANEWTTIVDLATADSYMAEVQVSVERTDQTNKSMHWIKVSSGITGGDTDGLIVEHVHHPDPLPDGGNREFRMSENKLQVRSTFALALVGTVHAIGSPFAL